MEFPYLCVFFTLGNKSYHSTLLHSLKMILDRILYLGENGLPSPTLIIFRGFDSSFYITLTHQH